MSTIYNKNNGHYSDDFKIKVAGCYLRGEGTYRELEKKFGAPKSRIHAWVRIFAESIDINPSATMTDMTPNAQEGQSGNSPSETNDKDKEIAMLKDQLWQAKKTLSTSACARMFSTA